MKYLSGISYFFEKNIYIILKVYTLSYHLFFVCFALEYYILGSQGNY